MQPGKRAGCCRLPRFGHLPTSRVSASHGGENVNRSEMLRPQQTGRGSCTLQQEVLENTVANDLPYQSKDMYEPYGTFLSLRKVTAGLGQPCTRRGAHPRVTAGGQMPEAVWEDHGHQLPRTGHSVPAWRGPCGGCSRCCQTLRLAAPVDLGSSAACAKPLRSAPQPHCQHENTHMLTGEDGTSHTPSPICF